MMLVFSGSKATFPLTPLHSSCGNLTRATFHHQITLISQKLIPSLVKGPLPSHDQSGSLLSQQSSQSRSSCCHERVSQLKTCLLYELSSTTSRDHRFQRTSAMIRPILASTLFEVQEKGKFQEADRTTGSGFQDIDDTLRGGFRAGCVSCISGERGTGKTLVRRPTCLSWK